MLPQIVDVAIGALITYLVVNGLKAMSEYFERDLTGNVTLVAAAITAIVVFAINTLLSLVVQIDPSTQSRIDALIQIIVIILGAMGAKRVENKFVAVLRGSAFPARLTESGG